MDEYNTGMDPAVKRYFRKILNTFAVGLLWLMVVCTAGFYFKLANVQGGWRFPNVAFYVLALLSLLLAVRYFYRVWREYK